MTSPAPIEWKDDTQTLAVDLEFLTPVFGGGSQSHKEDAPHIKPPDPHTPVRSSAFRGALRFWWRATSGAWCESVSAMRDKESEIFGSTERHGATSLYVDSSNLRLKDEFEYWKQVRNRRNMLVTRTKDNMLGISYGAFPLTQDLDAGEKGGTLHIFANTFRVTITQHPDTQTPTQTQKENWQQLHLALSALVAFGGLGGRTTRGFGQIAEVGERKTLLPRKEILAAIRGKGEPTLGKEVPAISPSEHAYVHIPTNGTSDGKTVLNTALGHLQQFRQGEEVGRRKGRDENNPKKLGRSYWPEPDEIRRLTKRRDKRHKDVLTKVRSFPRANFGLPIIFHFQTRDAPRDPHEDTTLQPSPDLERMRSPLQISVHSDGYSYLVLTAPRTSRAILKKAPGDPCVQTAVSPQQRLELSHQSPEARSIYTKPTDGKDYNVLTAFLQYVRDNSNR